MGINLFGQDIAKLLYDSIQSAGGLRPVILIRIREGERNPNDLTGGKVSTQTRYECEGFISRRSDEYRAGTLVRTGGETVVILGDSLPEGIRPRPGDNCIAEDRTFFISGVTNDPAEAVYTSDVSLLELSSSDAPVIISGAFSNAFSSAFDITREV